MKKILLAINNNKLEEKIKKHNNKNIIFNNIQYREGILEILEKDKKIENILISESLPGIISIEELIKKIKIINNEINIIIFLEREDTYKKNKLKKLQIKNIYLNKRANINKILSQIIVDNRFKKNNLKNKKTNKFIIKIKNFRNKYKVINKENKIITIVGKRKTGKTTIINLLLIYLLEKNKKILLINLNKKIENNYIILFGKKLYRKKRNNYLNNKKIKNIFLDSEIKIKDNFIFLNDFQKLIQKHNLNIIKYFFEYYIKKYDYVLFDIGNTANEKIKEQIIEKSNKKVIVIHDNLLGVQAMGEIEQKVRVKERKAEKSLHIIINKRRLNSISSLILKKFFPQKIKIDTILYNKEYEISRNKILKYEKIKNNLLLRNKLKNILN